MRVLALVLLLLINSFSLPLQAMNSHLMSANIPCNMQTMPGMMALTSSNTEMSSEQTSSETHFINGCQTMDHELGDASITHNDMTTSNCDMSGNGHCSTASSLPFISINKLVIPNSGRSTAVLYDEDSLPQQYPESLYRPPLIV